MEPNPNPNNPPNPTPNPNTPPNLPTLQQIPFQTQFQKSPKIPLQLRLNHLKKEVDDEPLTQKRKPMRISNIWEHFTKVVWGNPMNPIYNCNYCGADYTCQSTNVTSSLWVHIRKCKKNPERVLDKKHKLLSFKKETDGDSNLLAVTLNRVRCRTVLAKFVVKDEQVFRVVEGDGFRELVQESQPMFIVPSRVTIVRDIHHFYFKERTKLMEVLTAAGQRVCLTTNCWTSRTQMAYMCLTAHYVDSDWKLQKKIINFCQISNYKGDTNGKETETCLLD